MPVRAFEVIVGVRGDDAEDKEQAIADASRYLAYGDTSDTFGYHANVINVKAYGESNWDWGIGITFTAPFANDDELKRFMDEMANLARVESVEEVAYEAQPRTT